MFCTGLSIHKKSPQLIQQPNRQLNLRGFTLVEMLIALVLSSVIFLSAYQVMSNLIQYQIRAANRQVTQMDHLLLRNLFTQILGKGLHQTSLYYRIQKKPIFVGQPDELQLISRAYSDHFDDPGYRIYSIYRQESRLMVSYRRYDKQHVNESPEVLSTGLEISEINFQYFGEDGWLDQWTDQKKIPLRIKVKIALKDQQEFEWINRTGQL